MPFLDLGRFHNRVRGPVLSAMQSVYERGDFISGQDVAAFEEELGQYFGAQAVVVSSGTDALYLALAASGIGVDDEVVTSPFTFIATVRAIQRTAARPRFVDIESGTFMIPEHPQAYGGAGCVVPVHLFGAPFDARALNAAGIKVVADGAQTFVGAQPAALRSAPLCLSFFPSKILGGLGDGGAVVTVSKPQAKILRRLRRHGLGAAAPLPGIGGNYRLDSLQAAALRVKLSHARLRHLARKQHVLHYLRRLATIPELQLPSEPSQLDRSAWSIFTLRVLDRRRDGLERYLAERGIGSGVYYRTPLHCEPALCSLGYQRGDFPNAELASEQVLSLPLYPELAREELEIVCQAVADFFGRRL